MSDHLMQSVDYVWIHPKLGTGKGIASFITQCTSHIIIDCLLGNYFSICFLPLLTHYSSQKSILNLYTSCSCKFSTFMLFFQLNPLTTSSLTFNTEQFFNKKMHGPLVIVCTVLINQTHYDLQGISCE